jgi:anti-anti-sigma factor
MERFSCETTGDDGRVILTATGEIDLAAADPLWEALDQALVPGGLLVVDCSGVTFIDSTGLRTLIKAVHRAEEIDAGFRLAAVPAPVGRVFELAGVSELFSVDTGSGTS